MQSQRQSHNMLVVGRHLLCAISRVGRRTGKQTTQSCVHNDIAKYDVQDIASSMSRRYYSSCQPLPRTMIQQGYRYRLRLFSNSTDEVTIQEDTDQTSHTSTAATAPTLLSKLQSQSTSSQSNPLIVNDNDIEEDTPEQRRNRRTINTNKRLLIELQDAHELFHQIYTESQALLDKSTTSTSDEVVAMVDYFLILTNSLDLERYLEMVQSLHGALLDEQQKRQLQEEEDQQQVLYKDERAITEKLLQAAKSMSQLHHVFLKMVESCLPPLNSSQDESLSFDSSLYSDKTTKRGIHLSRRAEELGLLIHRPLYQRLAMGRSLTSTNVSLSSSEYAQAEDINESIAPNSEDLDQSKETVLKNNTSPLVRELLEILHLARLSLKIVSGEELHHLAEELLSQPFLVLLTSRRCEDAMSLLRGWQAIFDYSSDTQGNIDMVHLVGEDNVLKALDIVKGWIDVDNNFYEDEQINHHAMEITTLLELSLAEIIKVRKQRAEKLRDLIFELQTRNEEDDENDDGLDFDEQDTDYESNFDYDSEEDDEDIEIVDNPTPTTLLSQLEPGTVPKPNSEDTFTLIRGMSDREARQTIYLRNTEDWGLPDLVPQLEEWNKGKPLTFTPSFEEYVGRQMDKGSEEYDDDDI